MHRLLIIFCFSFAAVTGTTNSLNTDTNQTLSALHSTRTVCRQFSRPIKPDRFPGLLNRNETFAFYSQFCNPKRAYAWFDDRFVPKPQAAQMLASIEEAYRNGLNPEKYHRHELESYSIRLQKNGFHNAAEQEDLINRMDLLLTDAYITLSKDIYYGFTDWTKFKKIKIGKEPIEWDRPLKKPLLVLQQLTSALETDTVSLSLDALYPDYKEYARMVQALEYYRTLEGNTTRVPIPEGSTIKINDDDPRLPLIAKRLSDSGDLTADINDSRSVYDTPELIEAVRNFQIRHNLKPDALIGKKTVHAMNIPLSEKVTSILLNLERFRWLQHGMDQKEAYIDVNIPSFSLRLVEKGDQAFDMKIIVGKKERPTPVLESKIAYAVGNPSWTAPETIVKEDILGKDDVLTYLTGHNMKVYESVDGGLVEIDPLSIDWKSVESRGYAPYRFIAEAGKANPLGTIKFIFPNRYSVYLHDTNRHGLFNNDYRALSSGCVRLSEPEKLLTYLSPKEGTIHANVSDNRKIALQKKLPVILRYMTVGVNADQRVNFYEDIYSYDTLHLQTIEKINLADDE